MVGGGRVVALKSGTRFVFNTYGLANSRLTLLLDVRLWILRKLARYGFRCAPKSGKNLSKGSWKETKRIDAIPFHVQIARKWETPSVCQGRFPKHLGCGRFGSLTVVNSFNEDGSGRIS